MRAVRIFAGVSTAVALVACVPQARREPTVLSANAQWRGKFDFRRSNRLDFVLRAPDDAVAVKVVLDADVPELELHAQAGEPMEDLDQAPYSGTDEEGPPQIELDRFSGDRIAGELWYVSVCWPYEELPRVGDHRIETAKIGLEVSAIAARVDGVLQPGSAVESTLESSSGGFRSFRITVPSDARALRVDIFDVSSDLDLYALRGGPLLALDDAVAFSENPWGHETLLLTRDSAPPLAPGEWTVDVVDRFGPTHVAPFKILARFDESVPSELRALPQIPQARDGGVLARALAAVAEIATPYGSGSGTILSSDGWILTNAHVTGEDPEVEMVVSLSLDPTLPAEEAFRARLVHADGQRDLALVKVVSGLYGQPIPDGYELPTLPIGDAASLAIGDPVWLIGYPATGGTGSRVSISATRGILSGYERADFGVLLKTDAEITQGNSGGAAIDQRGELIGVPTSTVENGSGQIGYLHPIEALPASWRAKIGH